MVYLRGSILARIRPELRNCYIIIKIFCLTFQKNILDGLSQSSLKIKISLGFFIIIWLSRFKSNNK